MAITKSGTEARQQATLSTTNSFSLDAGTSPSLVTAVVIMRGIIATVTGVTYNGVAMTRAVTVDNGTALRTELWYLESPASGTNTLTASFGATVVSEVQAVAWAGTETTSSLDQAVPASGNSATPSVSITPTTNGQVIVGGIVHEDATALTTGAGETALFNNDNGAWVTSSSYAIQTTAATQVVDWTAGSANIYAAVAASFKEAAAGGISGSLAATLASLTASAIAAIDVSGSLSGTLESLTASAAGSVDISGAASGALDSLTLASAGSVAIDGTTAVTLDSLTATAAGSVDISGSLTRTLDDATLSSAGTVVSGITGSLAGTLDSLAVSSTATLQIDGATTSTLDNATISAASDVAIVGGLSGTLDSLALSSIGSLGSNITGSLAITLDNITAVSASTLDISGIMTASLGSLTAASDGAVDITGQMIYNLADATLSSTGSYGTAISIRDYELTARSFLYLLEDRDISIKLPARDFSYIVEA